MLCASFIDVHVFSSDRYTNCGDPMADKQHLLRTLAARAYISRQQILAFLKLPMNINLRALLEHHATEYHILELRIYAEAASLGVSVYPPDPCCLFISSRINRMLISFQKSNTALRRSVFKQCTLGIKDGHAVLLRSSSYPRIQELAQHLLDCEASCIHQLNLSQ